MISKLDIYLPEIPPSVESKIENGETLYVLPHRELYADIPQNLSYDLVEYTRLDRLAWSYNKFQSELSENTSLSFEEVSKLADNISQIMLEIREEIKNPKERYLFYERSAKAYRQALDRVPSEDKRRLLLLKAAGYWEMVAQQEKPLSAFDRD